MDCTVHEIAKLIDHSLLQPSLNTDELDKGICLARQYRVASVCILPYYLRRCSSCSRNPTCCRAPRSAFPTAATRPA